MSIVVQHRRGLLGRELVGDGPARRCANEAEPLLPVDAVDLVDDAVDVIGELGAVAPRWRGTARARPPASAQTHHAVVDGEAPGAEALDDIESGSRRAARSSRPRHRRRSSADATAVTSGFFWRRRAGGGVARVGERSRPLLGHALLSAEEIVAAHIDLAAHLDDVRRARRAAALGLSAMVRMLAVTFSPVAPSPRVAAVTSLPLLVAQRHRQAVDLGLGGEDELGVGGQAEEAPDAGRRSRITSSSENTLSSDSIGTAWRTCAKAVDGRRADARARAESSRMSSGKPRLDGKRCAASAHRTRRRRRVGASSPVVALGRGRRFPRPAARARRRRLPGSGFRRAFPVWPWFEGSVVLAGLWAWGRKWQERDLMSDDAVLTHSARPR